VQIAKLHRTALDKFQAGIRQQGDDIAQRDVAMTMKVAGTDRPSTDRGMGAASQISFARLRNIRRR
jgi:hypothetical protein